MIKVSRKLIISLLLVSFFWIQGCVQEIYPPGANYHKTTHAFTNIDWSPDGQIIAASSQPLPLNGISIFSDASEVYLWNPDDGSYQQISDETDSKWNANPNWSSQGDQIAYYSFDEFGANTLGVVDLESLNRYGITSGSSADWIPREKKLVINNLKEIILADLETGNETVIWQAERFKQITDLAVAPDGKFIAVAIEDIRKDTERYIYIIEIYGYEEFLLLQTSYLMQNLDWSPNGEWLIFTAADDVMALNTKTQCLTEPIDLGFRIDDVSWSPNNTEIAFATHNESEHGIMLVETDSEMILAWLSSGSCLK